MVQATFLAGSDVSLESGCLHKSASERGKPKTTEGDETNRDLAPGMPSLAPSKDTSDPARNVAWTINSVLFPELECPLAHGYYTPSLNPLLRA